MAKLLSDTRIYGTSNVDSVLAVGTVTPNTSTSNVTGSLQVTGGMGVSGNVFISTNNNQLAYNSVSNELSIMGTDPEIKIQAIITEPASPAANTLLIYSKSIAGRMLPKWKGPSGFDCIFQGNMAHNKIAMWSPGGSSTIIPANFGMNGLIATGTAIRSPTTSTIFTRTRRLGYNSAATAGASAGVFNLTLPNNISFSLGDPAINAGGFYYVCRFGSADTLASAIMFVGMNTSTVAPVASASPAAMINCIGVGCATGDTNLSIYYGGSAAQTPIALGASFPAKTNSTDLYELVLFAPSNSSTTVYYRVTNLSTSVEASGTLTAATAGTQLPLNTTFLGPVAYRTNNATATSARIDIVSIYIETDT